MIKSTKGKTRSTMIGNQNSVKRSCQKKIDFQTRMNHEDKLKLIKILQR